MEALELEQMAVEELALEQVAVEELELEQAYEGGDILGSSAAQRHSACNVEANLNSALPLLCHTTSPFLVPLPPPSPPPHGYTHSTHHLHSLPSTTAAHHHCRRHHHQNVGIPTTWVYPLYPSLPVSRYVKFIFKLREASLWLLEDRSHWTPKLVQHEFELQYLKIPACPRCPRKKGAWAVDSASTFDLCCRAAVAS